MAKSKRVGQNDLPAEVVERIRADIARWQAGLWAEEVAAGPTCICGKRLRLWYAEGGGIPTGKCEVNHADRDNPPDPVRPVPGLPSGPGEAAGAA